MFCTNCGEPIPEGGKFCTKCGAAVENENDSASPVNLNKNTSGIPKPNAPQDSTIYTAPPLPEQQTVIRAEGLKSVNGVWLFDKEHKLIKAAALTLIVCAVYSFAVQLVSSVVLQTNLFSGIFGIIMCIAFAVMELRCLRWAFLIPVLGRILDIWVIGSDLISSFTNKQFMSLLSAEPVLWLLIIAEIIQLLLEAALLVLLILAQRPLSKKVQAQR